MDELQVHGLSHDVATMISLKFLANPRTDRAAVLTTRAKLGPEPTNHVGHPRPRAGDDDHRARCSSRPGFPRRRGVAGVSRRVRGRRRDQRGHAQGRRLRRGAGRGGGERDHRPASPGGVGVDLRRYGDLLHRVRSRAGCPGRGGRHDRRAAERAVRRSVLGLPGRQSEFGTSRIRRWFGRGWTSSGSPRRCGHIVDEIFRRQRSRHRGHRDRGQRRCRRDLVGDPWQALHLFRGRPQLVPHLLERTRIRTVRPEPGDGAVQPVAPPRSNRPVGPSPHTGRCHGGALGRVGRSPAPGTSDTCPP